MMLAVRPCFVMISFYYADLQLRKFFEPVCLGNRIDGTTPSTGPTQLLNLPNPITCTYACTYECFSSHTSRIRESEGIFIVPESVLYVPVLQVMVLVVVTLWTLTFILSYAIDAWCLRESSKGDEQNLAASPDMGSNERISGSDRHSD